MPIFSLTNVLILAAAALALTACSESTVADGEVAKGEASDASTDTKDSVPCALNGAKDLQNICKHSVVGSGDAAQLLLEGPEGDFRRFTILKDGRGLESSDGAEPATIKVLDGGKIEVAVGDDIFVLPAKVKPSVADALPAEGGEPLVEPAVAPKPQ
jgi:hypothetical protein